MPKVIAKTQDLATLAQLLEDEAALREFRRWNYFKLRIATHALTRD